MKTSEEVKKGLACCNTYNGCQSCPYDDEVEKGWGCCVQRNADALAYIRQLEAKVPKWISVEDQPEPPEDDVYYCYGYWIGSGRKQAETAEYLCGEWKIENNFVLTHWMPMPVPPEEEV